MADLRQEVPYSPPPEDLRVFATVARLASFAAAAQALGSSTAYVSKRLRLLEAGLGTRLLHRTTRRVGITEDGERVYAWAQRILDDLDHLVQDVRATRSQVRGHLRVCSSFGFGRRVVAPLLGELQLAHPDLQVRLELFDRLVDVAGEGFDLDVRVGDEIAGHLIAHPLAANHRVLCAAPAYLARRGLPRTPEDLAQHDCLVIKERDHPFGLWRLQQGELERRVKVTGPLSSNQGEIVVQWAVAGHGLLLRSLWDVGPLLDQGLLQRILPDWTQPANVWAVVPQRLAHAAKVRVAVEHLQQHLPGRLG
ncbi:LysR family transcriptional regulator [Ideonella livida]|uniref:LysR family transcriptional regulator n=1 Tax=Ideonella livida TaxID=2707176 RepID=UPI00194037DC|nr:LysR family transcriptional regulator [Ideonella livida]